MFKTVAAVATAAVLLTCASAALADKPQKPKVCDHYSEATTSDGHKIGICAPSKAGGKPTYLSRYTIVDVGGSKVMIGYR